MDTKEVLEIFKKFGVITTGHFVYTSGRHGTVYLNKKRIYADSKTTYRLCSAIAKKFSGTADIDVVVGPESGAARLARYTARCLSKMKGNAIHNVSVKKAAGGFVLRPADIKKVTDKNVLVVEDVLTTYGTVHKVVELIRREGGFVIGIGALCDRSDPATRKKIDFSPRIISLAHIALKQWDEEECLRTGPCATDIPINTELGHGAEFLAKKKSA